MRNDLPSCVRSAITAQLELTILSDAQKVCTTLLQEQQMQVIALNVFQDGSA
jgi:hypothetical protein